MFMQIFFIYCALVITASGVLAISLRSPVHSVLMVLLLFFHMAGLYLTLNAEFLAAVQIIVYAGAILVLYLFVLFLVRLRDEVLVNPFVPGAWAGRVIAVSLALGLLWVIPSFTLGEKGVWTVEAVRATTHTKALGMELYTTYLLPFEIAALILLVALIGGLSLARRDEPDADSAEQEPASPAENSTEVRS